MADISKIVLSGTTYNIKDAVARAAISGVGSAMRYLGTTTTPIEDGSSATPVVIGGSSVTPVAGDVVIYGTAEFVWADAESKWREFGSTGSLKGLAFKDEATGNYTPSGNVSAPKVTVEANTTKVKPFGSAGVLPTLTMSVSGETLSLDWTAGTLPSAGAEVTVATGIKSATADAPTFSGTQGSVTVS